LWKKEEEKERRRRDRPPATAHSGEIENVSLATSRIRKKEGKGSLPCLRSVSPSDELAARLPGEREEKRKKEEEYGRSNL